MSPIRTLAPTILLPFWLLAACSSSSGAPPASQGPSEDAAAVDGSLGPLFCGLPVPATCPTSAPCAFSGWGCGVPVCDGYSVITDGVWIYYYSSPGGELAGEVLAADASFVSCPFGFQPPASCTPQLAAQCSDGGGAADAGGEGGT